MNSPNVAICGAYRLDVSPELFAQALQWKYAHRPSSDSERQAAEDHVRAELEGVVLLEVRIEHGDEHFRVDDFGQTGSDQAPYGEVFLTEDGTAVASGPADTLDVSAGQTVRVAFYLHFLDRQRPLNTSYGSVPIPAIEGMPSRLAKLVPYEPVT